jgi:Ca-activated chloride channel homolog
MDEQLEAERFSAQLDKLLAGEAVTPHDEEQAKDLEFAGRVARLDLSRQSRVKDALRTALMQRSAKRIGFSALFASAARVTGGVAAALLAAVFIAPMAFKRYAPDTMQQIQFMLTGTASHMGAGGGSDLYASGSSPYDSGVAGAGPGGGAKSVGESLEFLRQKQEMERNLALSKSAAQAPAARAMRRVAAIRGSGSNSLFNAGPASNYRGVANGPGTGGADRLLAGGSAEPVDREGYASITENEFTSPKVDPLSTFSIDVDAASYANVRSLLNGGVMPPADAVRVEEFINYFSYKYPEPSGEHPFSIATEVAACPWEPKHKLVRIGLKARSIPVKDLPPSSLTFLVDTSGSMSGPDRLALVQAGLRLLVEQLRPQDRVAIVAYAGAAGLVLPSTKGSDKARILAAIDALQSGGSTAGGAGILLAYQTARENFLKSGNNRVILATDGDFNVGVSSDGELTKLIEKERESGVYLTVLGVGRGNYQDAKMEQLADKGNGNFAYLDDIMEAKRVLVKEMGGTLVTLAKDVKLQVEFNPARVQAYRLIGYENRRLAAQDFNDDKKDAGELGAGHTVTALYEVVPHGVKLETPGVDALKYQAPRAGAAPEGEASRELLTVKFRYKKPSGGASLLLSRPLADETRPFAEASEDLRFAAAAAGFGLTLRGSKHRGDLSFGQVRDMARAARGEDPDGLRAEMIRLVERAELLSKTPR